MTVGSSSPPTVITSSGPSRTARRNYPLNCWWVAATPEEVSTTPLSRCLLDQRIVLFHTQTGELAALEDRCAHRWARLSQGKVIGEDVVCPYHGFRYNTRGACTLVPSQGHVPSRLKVRSFPVREQGPFVWVWMGDPSRSDPQLIPELPGFADAQSIRLSGYHEVRCNYMLIQENVLDLTHVPHLHGEILQLEGLEAPPAEVRVGEQTVTFVLTLEDVPLAPIQAAPMGLDVGMRVKRVQWGTFASPACHVSGVDVDSKTPASSGRTQFRVRAVHCSTPISANRSHYWWAAAQDYGRDVPNMEQYLRAGFEAVVSQDVTVLEGIQASMDEHPEGATELLVAADRAPVEANRILQRMLKAESDLT